MEVWRKRRGKLQGGQKRPKKISPKEEVFRQQTSSGKITGEGVRRLEVAVNAWKKNWGLMCFPQKQKKKKKKREKGFGGDKGAVGGKKTSKKVSFSPGKRGKAEPLVEADQKVPKKMGDSKTKLWAKSRA